MKIRSTEEQINGILRVAERPNASARAVARPRNISETTFYFWCNKYGGMGVPDTRRLKALEAENARLTKLVADQALATHALKEFAQGRRDARWSSDVCLRSPVSWGY